MKKSTKYTYSIILLIIGLGYFLLNKPGHFSLDSFINLKEGTSGIYESFHPPLVSFYVGSIYKITGSTSLIVILDIIFLLYFVWFLIKGHLHASSVAITVLLLSFLLSPLPLVYSGIIWKDVFIAHLSLFTFTICYSYREKHSWYKLLIALTLLAAITLIRQHGFVIAGTFALLLTSNNSKRPFLMTSGIYLGCIFSIGLLSQLIFAGVTASAQRMTPSTVGTGIRILKTYDIAGTISQNKTIDLSRFFDANFPAQSLQEEMREKYTPERVEYMMLSPKYFGGLTDDNIQKMWKYLVANNFFDYLAHRYDYFSWLMGGHGAERCLPIVTGFDLNPEDVQQLEKLQPSPRYSVELRNYAHSFYGSGLFTPYVYLLLGIFSTVVMTRKGFLKNAPFLTLNLAAFLYMASFFVTGIACDFRYLYFATISLFMTFIYALAVLFRKNQRS